MSIDYKASAALNFDDKTMLGKSNRTLGEKHREELIQDVVAMANAEGGIIIFGIEDKEGWAPPFRVRGGCNDRGSPLDRR